MERLLRSGEFAARASVSTDTLRRWARDGHVTYVQLPTGEKRYPESELSRVLEAQVPTVVSHAT